MPLLKVTALVDIEVTANVVTPQLGDPLRGIPPFTQGEKTFFIRKGEAREDISLVYSVSWDRRVASMAVPHPSNPGETDGIENVILLERLPN